MRASKVKTRDGDNYYCNNDDYDDDNYENQESTEKEDSEKRRDENKGKNIKIKVKN